jgi:hypothetical protein
MLVSRTTGAGLNDPVREASAMAPKAKAADEPANAR